MTSFVVVVDDQVGGLGDEVVVCGVVVVVVVVVDSGCIEVVAADIVVDAFDLGAEVAVVVDGVAEVVAAGVAVVVVVVEGVPEVVAEVAAVVAVVVSVVVAHHEDLEHAQLVAAHETASSEVREHSRRHPKPAHHRRRRLHRPLSLMVAEVACE